MALEASVLLITVQQDSSLLVTILTIQEQNERQELSLPGEDWDPNAPHSACFEAPRTTPGLPSEKTIQL